MDGRLITLGALGALALAGRRGSRSQTSRYHVEVNIERWDPRHEVAELGPGDWTVVLDTGEHRKAVETARRLWDRGLGSALTLGPVLGKLGRRDPTWRVAIQVWDDELDNPLDLPFCLVATYPTREQAELLVQRIIGSRGGSASWLGFGRGRLKSGKVAVTDPHDERYVGTHHVKGYVPTNLDPDRYWASDWKFIQTLTQYRSRQAEIRFESWREAARVLDGQFKGWTQADHKEQMNLSMRQVHRLDNKLKELGYPSGMTDWDIRLNERFDSAEAIDLQKRAERWYLLAEVHHELSKWFDVREGPMVIGTDRGSSNAKRSKDQALVQRVRKALSDDLRKPGQKSGCPSCGHCYVASEALWHLLGGKGSGWTPQSGPAPGGGTHWWLKHDDGRILDATEDQFKGGYDHSLGTGRGFLTAEPSRRAATLLGRVKS